MVNALLMRVHQSGHLAALPPERRDLVKEGLDYYKSIRHDIREAFPFWPMGLSTFGDDWVSLGLKCGKKNYIAVWRRGGNSWAELPIPHLKGKEVKLRCAYPSYERCEYNWNREGGTLRNEDKNRYFQLIENICFFAIITTK